jgi:hypothetical protein
LILWLLVVLEFRGQNPNAEWLKNYIFFICLWRLALHVSFEHYVKVQKNYRRKKLSMNYTCVSYGFDTVLALFPFNMLRSACMVSHQRRFRSMQVSKLGHLVTIQHMTINDHELQSWTIDSQYSMHLRWT